MLAAPIFGGTHFDYMGDGRNREDFKQPVSTNVISKSFRPLTHNQLWSIYQRKHLLISQLEFQKGESFSRLSHSG